MLAPNDFRCSEHLAGAIVVLAIGVGVVAWLRIDPSGEQGNGLSEAFDYDLEKYQKIDPALVHYRQTAEIPVDMREVRAVAVGPEDRIFVAGDKAVRVFAPDGKRLNEIALEHEPYCLAVGSAEHAFPGRHVRRHERSRRGVRCARGAARPSGTGRPANGRC